jgi:hypothetical protein
MKPSELAAGPGEVSESTLPYPRSDLADPPITEEEARTAKDSNCPRHGGLILASPLPEDRDGTVFFCGVGRQYWRYTKQASGFMRPLAYR